MKNIYHEIYLKTVCSYQSVSKIKWKIVFFEQSRFQTDGAFQVTAFADSNLINSINPVIVVLVCVEMWSSFNLMLSF